MKKTVIGLLTLAFLLSAGACDETAGTTPGKAEIWSAADTVKVLQDKSYEDKEEAAISVTAVRNEYEGAQILMTAETDVKSYTVATASLTSSTGKTYAAENVEVFNQKYITVALTTTNSFPSGRYPDALLPFETAEEYGENSIEAGNNQGVYFSFYIPKEQEAGIYTGNFTLTVDGVKNSIPVTLKVVDYTLDDEVHSRSSFGVHRYWNEGGIVSAEKDASYDMYAAYYEYLLEHRISTRYMPAALSDTEGFIKQLRKYAVDPKCSNYIIPYVQAYDSSFAGTGIDYEFYKETLNAIASASMEDKTNYLAKASTYFAMFDEITSTDMINKANAFYKKIYNLHGQIAAEWESSLTGDDALRDELVETLLSLNHLMVTTFDERFNVGVTWCPLLDKYNSEASKEKYQASYEIETENGYTVTQNEEKWWYSAGIPKNPYPSYHIDDNGYSPMVYSWMQYAHGVTGNLYWSTTFYLERVSENGQTVQNALQDYYETAMRFPSTNGDGFLLYPGAPYGIYGPVGCIRLEQLRDGLEEYDMLYALEEYYADKTGADFDSVMSLLYNNLFTGTRVETDGDTYEAMRSTLLSMLETAEKTGVLVLDVETTENDVDAKVFLPAGVSATFSGEQAGETETEGGKIVTVRQTLSGKVNDFTVLSGETGFSLDLGAERKMIRGDELLGTLETSAGDSAEKAEYEGQTVVQVNLAAKETGSQELSFGSAVYSLIGSETERVTLRFYSDTACKVTLYIEGRTNLSLPVLTTDVAAGYNELTLAATGLNWSSIGQLKAMYIQFGESGDNTARVIRLVEIEIM